ncbi:MAG: hypothetical protein OEZ10_13815 [Gammaproteobacteria bacterium]|nr:hypothetical protein [Gammaproteobacteria bacterium]
MSAMNSEKRNSKHGMTDQVQRVGGRHEYMPLALEGGGYLDICNISKPAYRGATDPRLDILRKLGLSDAWLAIATIVGFDEFIFSWAIMDDETATTALSAMPRFSRFKKYVRDQMIMDLASAGKSPEEIRATINKKLRDTRSVRHIKRIIEGGNR